MRTILVVEDHVATNELLCKLLQRAGYRTLRAFTGEGGLAMVTTEKPDLIILDQMMPGIDGIEALRILRSNPQTAFLPVIIYSAIAEPLFAEHAMSKGASDVWMKGEIVPTEIPARISQIIAKSETS